MMAEEPRYILADNQVDAERARLALLKEMADPLTIRRLAVPTPLRCAGSCRLPDH
jgi:hypothetical protein